MSDNVILTTPIPSDDLIYLVVGHRDRNSFSISRRQAVDVIVSLLSEVRVNIDTRKSILDFGCGCGRIIAGWEGIISQDTKLYGCDINENLVDFCQRNVRHAEVTQSSFIPPLSYDDATFDLVYAASVYTHMTLPAMLQWAGEFSRIIKSGGIAVVTIHGSYYHQELTKQNKNGLRILAEQGYFVHLHQQAEDTWKGSNAYATFATHEFMKRIFAGFEIMGIFPGISHGPTPFVSYQDVMIFRRT